MANNNYRNTIKRLGISDRFVDHGTQKELYDECKYDARAIIKTVHEILVEKEISQAV